MKKITPLILIVVMILTALTVPVLAAPDSSACIKVTATFVKYEGGISFAGYNINGYDAYNYKFVAGDRFEYEVYLETKAAGLGFIDIQASKLKSVDADGNELHEWKLLRSTDSKDSQEIECHPVNDLTGVAYQKWYKRSITIPKSMEGFMTRHIFPMAYKAESSTPVLPTTPEVFYVRNVVIVGADGTVKQTIFNENERFISSTKVEGAGGAKLVLTGENQKAATASTGSVSKSVAGSTAGASQTTVSGGSTASASNGASSIVNSAGMSTDSKSTVVSDTDDTSSKGNSDFIIVILAVIIVLLIAGGITGFFIMKKKMAVK